MNNISSDVPNSKGVLVHCTNKECRYKWLYKGRSIFYASCPCCRRNIRITDNKVESLQSDSGREPEQIAVTVDITPTGADAI